MPLGFVTSLPVHSWLVVGRARGGSWSGNLDFAAPPLHPAPTLLAGPLHPTCLHLQTCRVPGTVAVACQERGTGRVHICGCPSELHRHSSHHGCLPSASVHGQVSVLLLYPGQLEQGLFHCRGFGVSSPAALDQTGCSLLCGCLQQGSAGSRGPWPVFAHERLVLTAQRSQGVRILSPRTLLMKSVALFGVPVTLLFPCILKEKSESAVDTCVLASESGNRPSEWAREEPVMFFLPCSR